MIADDGEGATHFITIDVEGCRDVDDARAIARAVADSPLVKTAIHGADPNWGRIVSAAGYAGVPFEEEELSLWINDVPVYRDGVPVPFDAAALSRLAQEPSAMCTSGWCSSRGAEADPVLDLRPDRRVHPAQRGLHDLRSPELHLPRTFFS